MGILQCLLPPMSILQQICPNCRDAVGFGVSTLAIKLLQFRVNARLPNCKSLKLQGFGIISLAGFELTFVKCSCFLFIQILVNGNTVNRDCYHDCQEVDGGDGYQLGCCSSDLCNSCSTASPSLILLLGLTMVLVSLNILHPIL